jgi:prepilin-type N-terminal cleavage/methylation domain-containing protein
MAVCWRQKHRRWALNCQFPNALTDWLRHAARKRFGAAVAVRFLLIHLVEELDPMLVRLKGCATVHANWCRGYTLVELLVAVMVGVVLTAVAAPRLSSFRAQFQLAGDARAIAVQLQRAKMKAVAENAFCRLTFFTGGTYSRQCSPDGVTFTPDGSEMNLGSSSRFVNTLGGLPQPTFNRLGTATADTSVTVSNSLGQRKSVRVNVLGRVTVQ